MHDPALEVESNIMASEKPNGNVDRMRQRGESSSSLDPKIDKMTKMIESLASEISKLKFEQHPGKGRVSNTFAPRNPIHIEELMSSCRCSKEAKMPMKTKG